MSYLTWSLYSCLGVALFLAPFVAAEEESPVAPIPDQAGGSIFTSSSVAEVPALGEIILEDPLIGSGVIRAGVCPTTKVSGEYVGEGFLFKVRGKCREAQSQAGNSTDLPNIQFSDGEVRIEAKSVTGIERASIFLGIRLQASQNPLEAYQLHLQAGRGIVSLNKERSALDRRDDLTSLVAHEDWNSFAVRAKGDHLWALVNDQVVLSAVEGSFAAGGVFIGLQRLGDVNDDAESAVVLRNLSISRLAQ